MRGENKKNKKKQNIGKADQLREQTPERGTNVSGGSGLISERDLGNDAGTRGSSELHTKKSVTGSDYDGQPV